MPTEKGGGREASLSSPREEEKESCNGQGGRTPKSTGINSSLPRKEGVLPTYHKKEYGGEGRPAPWLRMRKRKRSPRRERGKGGVSTSS